ncbi:MAG: D-alanine--D-alanine ligase [Candidatus Omnitrophica bacterium]|nr:D-alanine--D-alanine ligase [Candidatus Omnitrophota bacterium]
MGGPSSEREISLKSGKYVYESLRNLGLQVVAVDIQTNNSEEAIHLIKSNNLDCVFLALHGHFGEDGQIQQILDDLGIPYTGSGPLASRLAMDKVMSRKIFQSNGLNVPSYKVLDRLNKNKAHQYEDLNPPLVVKPATHGSSIGLSIVDDKDDLDKALDLAFSFDERIIIEEYIKGREMTIGILAEEALPVIEIIPKKRFFDFEAKYQPGMTEYVVPAQIEEEISERLKQTAYLAHQLLGCKDFSRVDMILSQQGVPFVLEINSIPGLTPTSLLPKAAKAKGIEFDQLCLKLIELAYEKTKIKLGY